MAHELLLVGLQSALNHIEDCGYDYSEDMMLAWFELVGHYHNLLSEISPDWLQVHYYSRLTEFIKAKANRSTYELALRLVKAISNRKNGQQIAKEILESWQEDFKKRPQLLGMIEEELKGMA
ncbi:MAG: hypothetical protein HUJ84_06785 [Veillonella sp.]|nr:hypothetical protein [Veillonella sp.]